MRKQIKTGNERFQSRERVVSSAYYNNGVPASLPVGLIQVASKQSGTPCIPIQRHPIQLQQDDIPRKITTLTRSTSPEMRSATTATSRFLLWLETRCSADIALQLNSSAQSFDSLTTATTEPPITLASLSELDLPRIYRDMRLRHDLNFEPEVAFRPNYEGSRGTQKRLRAEEFWKALSIELDLYLERTLQSAQIDPSTSLSLLLREAQAASIPWRVRKLFTTIRDIIKTLVPVAEHAGVERILDVDLILQQLENGVYDLLDFSEWLGALLKRSCSPVRDTIVLGMVESIQTAASARDASRLTKGIESLFCVLEIMKLDVANHQIRALRLLIMNEGHQCEQSYFSDKMLNGMDVSKAYDWYQLGNEDELPKNMGEASGLDRISRAIGRLVVSNDHVYPNTFSFDFDRLSMLQSEFQEILRYATCCEAIYKLAMLLGYTSISFTNSDFVLPQRIVQIDEDWFRADGVSWQSESIALEVVREAYRMCSISTIPTDEHIEIVMRIFEEAGDAKSHTHRVLTSKVSNRLEILVDGETKAIRHLTSLQILDHHEQQSLSQSEEQGQYRLNNIAQRIAHLSVIHWRIWGPILYLQERPVFDRSRGSVQSTGEAQSNISPVLAEN